MTKILINPPPKDGRCNCCGKKAKLIKTFRAMAPKDDIRETLINEVDDWNKLFMHNKRLAADLSFYDQLVNTVEASWECNDCISLEGEEFYNKQESRNE